jgi:signal transduction histidine kinase
MEMLGIFILLASFTFLLSSSQKKILKQKEIMQIAEIEHQKQLLRAVVESQESERRRIGQDLHDDVGTALSNLRITGERYAREMPGNEALNKLVVANKKMIDKIISDVRNISHALSPEILTIHTLSEAIEELCGVIEDAAGLSVVLMNGASGVLDGLKLTAALVIYRVLEELMTNTIRHAGASSIDVSIRKEGDRLIIEYRDNGKGVAAVQGVKKGHGLQNIESRLGIIGALYILSALPGSGYYMRINIPIPGN